MKPGRSGSPSVSVIHVSVRQMRLASLRQMRLASLYSWRNLTQAASSVSLFLKDCTFPNTTEGRGRLYLHLLALNSSSSFTRPQFAKRLSGQVKCVVHGVQRCAVCSAESPYCTVTCAGWGTVHADTLCSPSSGRPAWRSECKKTTRCGGTPVQQRAKGGGAEGR